MFGCLFNVSYKLSYFAYDVALFSGSAAIGAAKIAAPIVCESAKIACTVAAAHPTAACAVAGIGMVSYHFDLGSQLMRAGSGLVANNPTQPVTSCIGNVLNMTGSCLKLAEIPSYLGHNAYKGACYVGSGLSEVCHRMSGDSLPLDEVLHSDLQLSEGWDCI